MVLPLTGQQLLMFVGDVYEDLELWYPKLRMLEAGRGLWSQGQTQARRTEASTATRVLRTRQSTAWRPRPSTG